MFWKAVSLSISSSKKKVMKKGLLKIILDVCVLIAILVAVDIFVGWVGREYTQWLNKQKPKNRDSAYVNYDLNAATPDVAIIGSSTAICHYVPDIIHDSLLCYTGKDYEVFNMGVSYQKLAYNYYSLKGLLERTKPALVIVDVWANYCSEQGYFERFNAFKPYINSNDNVKDMFRKHDKLSVLTISNMYCYNSELFYLLMVPFFETTTTNGYLKWTNTLDKAEKSIKKDTTELVALSVEEFDSMIGLAKEKQVPLCVVLSPALHSSDTSSLSYQYMRRKCMEVGIPFLDYSNDESFYKPDYFRDESHMNCFGAELFTKELMSDIKELFYENL